MIVSLGGHRFASKGALRTECSRIIRTARRDCLLNGDDDRLFRALVDAHPDRDAKLAGGCQGIAIRRNCLSGAYSQGPHVVPESAHLDATGALIIPAATVPFSYITALGIKSVGGSLQKAARQAVTETVIMFRNRQFNGSETCPCAITGKPLTRAEANVDHADPWPFRRILDEFKEFWQGDLSIVDSYWFDPFDDTCHVDYCFNDPLTSLGFRLFHDERAGLRIIDKRLNHVGWQPIGEVAARVIAELSVDEALAQFLARRRE